MSEHSPRSEASEAPCRAVIGPGEAPPNPLFTPPCDCPHCAPQPTGRDESGAEWLRMSGRAQRYRVRTVELGRTGRSVLG